MQTPAAASLGLKILVLISLAAAVRAESDLLVDRLKARGFTCTPSENGDLCRIDRVNAPGFKYSQPVVIVVPKNVRRPTDLLLHLHGHRGVCPGESSPENMVKAYDLPRQMKEAGAANSVMIFPVSTGQCTTFEKELAPNFAAFAAWVKGEVQPAKERWTISGHSGAFRPIGTILGRESEKHPELVKKINSVLLLDATYSSRPGYYDQWKSAARVNPNMDVATVYRTGGGTEAGSRMLKKALPNQDVDVVKSKTASHCEVPNRHYADLLRKSLRSSQGSSAGAGVGQQ